MVNIIKRQIQDQIEKSLFQGKIVIVYGARQVGKTTLVKEIQKKYSNESTYLNCDEIDIRQALEDRTSTELKGILGNKKLVIIDEAQRVKNIGLTLKLIVDNFPQYQIIATGSSSFELSNKIKEPLTGRKYEFYLYPISLKEMKSIYSDTEMDRLLDNLMILGMYPEIVSRLNDLQEAKERLRLITSDYLYKDVLQYQGIRNPEIVEKLLQALALQIGNQVSYNELAATVGIDKRTVASYIRILEQAFIVFRLNPFSRNLRNELKKTRKIYFYDIGIRNALINNFNTLNLRNDIGPLWENFMIGERLKNNNNSGFRVNSYFWRTTQQQELDYIEDKDGLLNGFEFKYSKDKGANCSTFLKTYKGSTVEVINKDVYRDFIGL